MCYLDLVKFWLSHFQFHNFSDSVCFGLDSRTFVIEATEWIGFLARIAFWCAVLIGIPNFVWARLPARWKQPTQLPSAQQKRARKIHAGIGYGFSAFLLLGGLLQLVFHY